MYPGSEMPPPLLLGLAYARKKRSVAERCFTRRADACEAGSQSRFVSPPAHCTMPKTIWGSSSAAFAANLENLKPLLLPHTHLPESSFTFSARESHTMNLSFISEKKRRSNEPRCGSGARPLTSDSESFQQRRVKCSFGVGQCLQIRSTWP